MANNFKSKLKREEAEALTRLIEYITVNVEDPSLSDLMLLALLNEIAAILKRKQLEYKPLYKMELSPAQAIALRLMCSEFITIDAGNITQLEAKLLLTCNEIEKQYKIYDKRKPLQALSIGNTAQYTELHG